jgi:hypothetical protein
MGFKKRARGIFELTSSTQWTVALVAHSRIQAGIVIVEPGVRSYRKDISEVIGTGLLQHVEYPSVPPDRVPPIFASSLVNMMAERGYRRETFDYRFDDEEKCEIAAKMIADDVLFLFEDISKLLDTKGVLSVLKAERRRTPQRYVIEIAALLFAEHRYAELNKFVSGLKAQHLSPLDKSFIKYLKKRKSTE